MSVDVQRVTESVVFLNGLWLPLVWIIVCFVYLWQVCSVEGAGWELNPTPSPSSLDPVSICTLWADIMGNI